MTPTPAFGAENPVASGDWKGHGNSPKIISRPRQAKPHKNQAIWTKNEGEFEV